MLFITEQEVRDLLDLHALQKVIAECLVQLSRGAATMAPRVIVQSETGLTANMTALVPSLGVVATKTVTVFPGNSGTELPSHQASILLTDATNGTPMAVMGGTYITAARTAAASAIATDLLAAKDASVMSILGTGVQARSHARAIPLVRKISQLRIWGRDPSKAQALANELQSEGTTVRVFSDLLEAQSRADIICATTHSPLPLIIGETLAPNTHVNSVGVNIDGREVDADTVARASVIAVESRKAAMAPPEEAGANDLTWAAEDGALADLAKIVELGELLVNPIERQEGAVTLYKGVGAAVEDAAAAWLVLKLARETGVGKTIE